VGAPAIDAGQGKRAYGMIQYLPEIKQSIRELQVQMKQLLSSGEDKPSRPEDSQSSDKP
jgi:hypothetical protein